MAQEGSFQHTNIARDHANVNVQAGHVSGNVSVGATDSAALRGLLAELREELAKARAGSELDAETFAAATEELSEAGQQLAVWDAGGRGKLIIALKRLKGLVADVADLAYKVATAIAAARSLR